MALESRHRLLWEGTHMVLEVKLMDKPHSVRLTHLSIRRSFLTKSFFFFQRPFGHLYVFAEEVSVQLFPPFFDGLVVSCC